MFPSADYLSEFLSNTGNFLFPLLLCSFVGLWVLGHRLWSLRRSRILPKSLLWQLGRDEFPEAEEHSIGGRVVGFAQKKSIDASSLRAFVSSEIGALERGLFLMDVVVAVAPLIGLLGTVAGLVDVFAQTGPGATEDGLPDTEYFSRGVALALSTTMLGLCIAIPALAANSYLRRRIDIVEVELELLAERLLNLR